MALGIFGRGYEHRLTRAKLQEKTFASILSCALTLAIFLGPLLITVERRVAITGSLQVFILNSIEGEGLAPDPRERREAQQRASPDPGPDPGDAPVDADAAAAPAPQPQLAPSAPEQRLPEPIPLPDFAATLNASAEGLVSLSPQILGDVGSNLGFAGVNGAPGAGGSSGEGSAAAGGGGVANIYTASWAPDMDFSMDHKHYPRRAAKARVEGVAWLKCRVIRGDRVRDCQLIGESPKGYGFGSAALKTQSGLRIRLHDQTGRRVYDQWTMVTSTFRLSDLEKLASN